MASFCRRFWNQRCTVYRNSAIKYYFGGSITNLWSFQKFFFNLHKWINKKQSNYCKLKNIKCKSAIFEKSKLIWNATSFSRDWQPDKYLRSTYFTENRFHRFYRQTEEQSELFRMGKKNGLNWKTKTKRIISEDGIWYGQIKMSTILLKSSYFLSLIPKFLICSKSP